MQVVTMLKLITKGFLMSHLLQFFKNIVICKLKEVVIQHLVYDFMQVKCMKMYMFVVVYYTPTDHVNSSQNKRDQLLLMIFL